MIALDKLVQPAMEPGRGKKQGKLELLALGKPGPAVVGVKAEKSAPFRSRRGSPTKRYTRSSRRKVSGTVCGTPSSGRSAFAAMATTFDLLV